MIIMITMSCMRNFIKQQFHFKQIFRQNLAKKVKYGMGAQLINLSICCVSRSLELNTLGLAQKARHATVYLRLQPWEAGMESQGSLKLVHQPIEFTCFRLIETPCLKIKGTCLITYELTITHHVGTQYQTHTENTKPR